MSLASKKPAPPNPPAKKEAQQRMAKQNGQLKLH